MMYVPSSSYRQDRSKQKSRGAVQVGHKNKGFNVKWITSDWSSSLSTFRTLSTTPFRTRHGTDIKAMKASNGVPLTATCTFRHGKDALAAFPHVPNPPLLLLLLPLFKAAVEVEAGGRLTTPVRVVT